MDGVVLEQSTDGGSVAYAGSAEVALLLIAIVAVRFGEQDLYCLVARQDLRQMRKV